MSHYKPAGKCKRCGKSISRDTILKKYIHDERASGGTVYQGGHPIKKAKE